HGIAASSAPLRMFCNPPLLQPRAQRLLGWRPDMRLPAVVALSCLLLARVAPAGSRRCGDDADGRGTAAPCHGGAVRVGARPLGRVWNVIAADNDADGFNVAGTGFTVTSCEATHNGRDGFALRGLRYRVEGNRATENGRYGFSLAGREAALGGALGNEATGNRRDGLVVRGRSHDLAHPVATANGAGGIRARLAGGRVRGAVAINNRGVGVHA